MGITRESRQKRKPNTLLSVSLAIAALSVGYYFTIALPSHNQAMLALERERRLDERLEKSADKRTSYYRQECMDRAEEHYWEYIKLNGTEVPGKKGVYQAPGHIWDAARKDKDSAFAECQRRWK